MNKEEMNDALMIFLVLLYAYICKISTEAGIKTIKFNKL